MDRYGRVFVAVPAMIVLGAGFALLPLAQDLVGIAAIAGLMGLGNGISAGIVMTLGADAAPEAHRAQFLSGWRLASDLGHAGGPLVITAVSAVAPLAAAAVAMGVITWAGAGWLIRWVPAYAVRTRSSL
jgi:MFS family permease